MAARTRLLFPALLLLAACGAQEQAGEDAEAVRVAVAVAEEATFGERFSLTGTLTAERDAQLSPRVDGLVARVHVDAGDRVGAGQVLVELDPAVGRQALARVRAQVAEAEAAAREAGRLFAEARRLGEDRYIAASQVDARESELRLAQAALESARASAREQAELVERHVLPAPFDGVVAEKLTEAGEWVQRGTPVLSLVATDRVRLDLRAPQERFAQLDDDARVRVFADALGGAPLPARIGARVPVTDPGARTFLLRLLVDDPEARLLPGTSARAEIDLPAEAPALAVSRDALLRQPDGGHSLFVVEDGEDGPVARQRSVRVLRERDELVAVSGDLQPGQRVVVRGNEALEDGQPVDVAGP
ncbi:efflux RND transporter periplasmic adaptor subunit [Luteimonas sp. R10]|uniref:efflux RND transporter periplasmic adaptor subunit n=1 Tax=Luteimonas sp. R10 TaxID=3108176 RepID=UPI00308F71B6|nr:efflux RND transporter periplasmic adaptor subunit [Luteimonas sp. R10]